MVSTSANRKAFIASNGSFLRTYNFDGVDLDWEYPAANDRGGIKADKANFVKFLQELRSAFGSRYGISLTLLVSFWYLQGFDVKAIQQYVDWMNMMFTFVSRKMLREGVWDSGNKHTGPYLRPHTNLTEIDEGLDLLWRAGVDPSKVVLGLGWYGRSFTLSNPGCNVPNGACTFTEGGRPGECTNSAGTLTNAEINRIIAKGGVTKGFNQQAAVKWITWDSNQWVSYGDGETIQLKINHANTRCLAGKMIWAVDQDDSKRSSTNDLLSIGPANGISAENAQKVKDGLNIATEMAAIASSCYWTFCGKTCKSGYFGATEARGQISGIQRDTECPQDQTQMLCCAPGTTIGQCSWDGILLQWLRTIIQNQHGQSRPDRPRRYHETRNGKRSRKRHLGRSSLCRHCSCRQCRSGFAAGRVGKPRQRKPGSKLKTPAKPRKKTPSKKYGQWDIVDYGLLSTATKSRCDCAVTYTCKYGKDWDEVCDNQRWGIDKALHGNTVYNYQARGNTKSYMKHTWNNGADAEHHDGFKKLAQAIVGINNGAARCQVDEFAIGALRERLLPNQQVVRLVNGPANGRQSNDFKNWRSAVWMPCSVYKEFVCGTLGALAEPPITWAFDSYDQGRLGARTDGSHFVQAYGFDSQTAGAECWATYVLAGASITVKDHGLRVLSNDPVYTVFNWPKQGWWTKPAKPYPTDVASANYLKREAVKSVLRGEAPYVKMDHYEQPEHCVLVDDDEGGMTCIPDHYIFDDHHDLDNHDLHDHAHKRHHQHHRHIAAHTVTSATTGALPTPDTEHTQAKAGQRSPGPVQTPSA
ncbi:glycoside hydrolase [Ophiobolus disseminans]|uniref:chitinase n=1 Tax=Ophiobolus disseminans TaxID=1469910 RepID=A0A6A6ZF64_9PLEO|nr:glycoside hydrolase [Ophiobolus disseminans]